MNIRILPSLLFLISTIALAASEQPFSFENADHVVLEGVISSPVGPEGTEQSIKAVALILPGSTAVKADGDVSGPLVGSGFQGGNTKLSEQIAELMAKQGIASFRYNKRNFYNPADSVPLFSKLVSDAKLAAEALVARYPHLPFYIVGMSEGALIATHLAPVINPTGLFLISTPAGNIDDWLRFQAFEWPVQLLRARVDHNHNGRFELNEFQQTHLDRLPLLGLDVNSIQLADTESFHSFIFSGYQNYYRFFLALESSREYQPWYLELTTLKDASFYLMQYSGKVWFYNGALDAQVDPLASFSLAVSAKNVQGSYLFENLGHCLSLHEGVIQEIKTAGPLHQSFTNQFTKDLLKTLTP